MKRRPICISICTRQVLFAITCGVVLGHFCPDTGAADEAAGDGFIKLIKDDHRADHFLPPWSPSASRRDGGHEEGRPRRRRGAALFRGRCSTLALIIGLIVGQHLSSPVPA